MKTSKLVSLIISAAGAGVLAPCVWTTSASGQEKVAAPARGDGVSVLATASATVKAVDADKRTVTVETADGATATFKCGKDVTNFDQIKAGDHVRATLIERLAISIGTPASPPNAGDAGVVALAPKGAKPGFLIAHTSAITDKIDAVDAGARTVTLQGVAGGPQTIKVAPAVDLAKLKKGDDVTVRCTEGFALMDEKAQRTPEDAARTAAAAVPPAGNREPGAAMMEGVTLSATVEAVDPAKRLVTLKDAESGGTKVIHLGKECINFDQIKVGDRVRATLAEQVAVAVTKGGAPPSASDGALVARAPLGSKPGMIVATTMQAVGKIGTVDAAKRTITIAEAEGKPLTLKVAPSVDLADLKPGDDVTAQCTQAMAIVVEGR